MPQEELIDKAGEIFGFGKLNLGLGMVGNLMVWLIISAIAVIIIGIGIYIFIVWRSYKHKIKTFAILGNRPMLKWEDRAKEVKVGRAGDRLFYLRRQKRWFPPPVIQSGINEWWFWERDDGEFINIGLEDLNEKQRQLGIRFIDTDMRMQRLGIEKNLQYRLQEQNFWEKYGDKIINLAFYVFVTLMMVVLFFEWRKTAESLQGVADSVAKMNADSTASQRPEGLIPTLVLFLTTKYKIWKLRR